MDARIKQNMESEGFSHDCLCLYREDKESASPSKYQYLRIGMRKLIPSTIYINICM